MKMIIGKSKIVIFLSLIMLFFVPSARSQGKFSNDKVDVIKRATAVIIS